MDNAILPIFNGNEKRPGTQYIQAPLTSLGQLDATNPTSNSQFFHWIDRDDTERFLITIDDSRSSSADYIEAFGLDGTKYTVNYDSTDARDYVAFDTVAQDQKTVAVTIADSTFILNQRPIVALTGTAPGYTITHDVTSWADLPSPSSNGIYGRTSSDYPGHPAGIYVSQNVGGDPPYWVRVTTDADNSEMDATTLPVKLTFDGTDFHLDQITWNTRLSGDSETNPGPSIVGHRVEDIIFHRNRFWLAGDEQIVSSQAGDLFNLWVDNYAVATDADPIDQQLSGNSVNNITHLLGFNKALIVMTDGAQQYEIRSQDVLTPSSVNVTPSTAYSVADIRPVILGNQLYFVTDHSKYTSIWEYYYDYEAANTVATLITAHAQGYIPPNVTLIKGSPNNDMLFVLSSDEPNVLYVYQMFWTGDEKVQDAWFRWVFDDSLEILSFHIYENELYLLVRYNDGLLYLEKMFIVSPPVPDGMPYAPRMDRVESVSGTYSPSTQKTTFTLSYNDSTIDEVVLGPDWGDRAGMRVAIHSNDSTGTTTVLEVFGDWSANAVYAGRNYEHKVTLSQQYVKDENGTVVEGNLQLRNMTVYHRDTGTYNVVITPYGRSPITRVFTPSVLGRGNTLLGQVLIEEEGEYYTKIMGAAGDTTIDLINDTPLPSTFTGVEFIGTFIQARRNISK
ncbi:MAG: hypothetical protein D6698_10125 [Gammaproteobacteria bacterium]|nr:MAG: hypothetical protein D6698_10125 [Gammaproteobacteria bacterium]